MRIVGRRQLRDSVDRRAGWPEHAQVRAAVGAWISEAAKAAWRNQAELRSVYPTAIFGDPDSFTIRIPGTKLLLVVDVRFDESILHVSPLGQRMDREIDVY